MQASTPKQLELPMPLPRDGSGARWGMNPKAGAAFCMLAAAGFYALVLIFAKAAGERLHPTQILLFRSLVMLVCAAPAIAMNFPHTLRTVHFGLHSLRISASFFSMLLAFIAVIHLPLADATTLSFSKGFFVILFAAMILGEVTGARKLAAVAVGFAGVVIVLQPEGDRSINIYGILAIAAAASSGLADIFVRWLSRTDSPITIMAYQAIGLGFLMLPPAIWFWIAPNDVEIVLLVGVGVFSALAQYCNTLAYRAGDVGVISTLDYTRLLFIFALSLLLFRALPEPRLLLGAAIIVCTGIYAMRVKKVASKPVRSRVGATAFSGASCCPHPRRFRAFAMWRLIPS